ncbi:MAG TPA: ACP S-malonyltransferase [Micromonosporaceae bacterium]|nr:ACP S-malonyltransferase [Micromonosporaceae bacterium]
MRAFVFPGQGSQARGMGGALFEEFPELTAAADEALGYSIADLCLRDADNVLGRTEYTQPALFVVSALSYLDRQRREPVEVDFFAGHSLGEYTALYAAGALDFISTLRLVALRGRLMATMTDGGMAAVVGMAADEVRAALDGARLDGLDLANLNTQDQVVISGPVDVVRAAGPVLTAAGAGGYTPLRVSGAFHSRYMRAVSAAFAEELSHVDFAPLKKPVIANCTGLPYADGAVRETLVAQLVEPVRWEQSVRYLLGLGVDALEEVGPGRVLTRLIEKIRSRPAPSAAPARTTSDHGRMAGAGTTLGSAEFRRAYGLRHAYVCGSMYRGIASTDLVIRACRAGVLAFFGAAGLSAPLVAGAVARIRAVVGERTTFGVSLAHDPVLPDNEQRLVETLLATGVPVVEASAFVKVTPALVRYRLSGLTRAADGSTVAGNRIIAKLSRPEVAEGFLAPPPQQIVDALLASGAVTREQAGLAANVPMADDICVEGDSGGHTDRRDLLVLLPVIRRLSERTSAARGYRRPVRVGAAGGIGTPQAAAAAFLLGADFIVTGSVNLCTAESGTSAVVKDMLQRVNIQDTDHAPAGDMFELGAQAQVLKRGVFFPARARKLHELYRRFDSLDDIDADTRQQIEERYFRRTLDEVWQETRAYFAAQDTRAVARAETSPKHKMALVFRWYFEHSQRAAMEGREANRLDFQVHCGPSLGAFNQWVAGTELERWQDRHVDDIAERIMAGAAAYLRQRYDELGLAGDQP